MYLGDLKGGPRTVLETGYVTGGAIVRRYCWRVRQLFIRRVTPER